MTDASNSQQKPAWKPLSIAQANAIDLRIVGKTDGEVADTIGVNRTTVWEWRTRHPVFMATLEQRRAEVYRVPVERLRSLAATAVDNIATAINEGSVRWSFELLKAINLYGREVPILEQDPQQVFNDIVTRQLAKEKISDLDEVLLTRPRSPRRAQRQAEIEAELQAEYGENCSSKLPSAHR
jgi:hypothetical protein